MLKFFYYTLLALTISSCSRGQKRNSSISTIDIEANINKMDIVYLSQFTDDIEYIPLQTKEDLFLKGIAGCRFSDSVILVNDYSKCELFNSKGDFLNEIGTRGRGPGEFEFLYQADLLKSKTIYIQSTDDLLEYKMNGSFLNMYRNTFRIDGDDIRGWNLINDSLFFGNVANYSGQSKYKALILNKKGNVKYTFKNYDQFNRKKPCYGCPDQYVYFNIFRSELFYKQFFIDTLFLLNNDYELIPKYSFNLGRLKMPASVRASNDVGFELWDYISMDDVFQTEDYLLLKCRFGHRFPAKRFTAQTSIYPGGDPIWINTNYVLGIYSKHTGDFRFCKPTSTDNPLFTSGIYNDIDAGPRFFPTKQVNDSTLFMWIDANMLKEHVASDDFKNNVPKYPEKKKQLEELANNLNELDNPVLMLVTFKKR
jgi:hypothetical protein